MPAPITHAEAFGVQPFSNVLMVRSFTGAEIEAILEQQFVNRHGRRPRVILQVSAGFTYTYSPTAAAREQGRPGQHQAQRDHASSPTGTYQVAMNNFLGFGGDSFPTMLAGDIVKFGEDDLVALEAYLAVAQPVQPGDGRRARGSSSSPVDRTTSRPSSEPGPSARVR